MSNSRIIFAAAFAGVAIGIFLAPKKGTELRQDILDTIDELGNDLNEVKEKVLGMADNIKSQVADIKNDFKLKVEHVKEGIEDVKTTAEHAKQVFS